MLHSRKESHTVKLQSAVFTNLTQGEHDALQNALRAYREDQYSMPKWARKVDKKLF